MLTLEKFTGINNVLPSERLQPTELREATNVDIGVSGEIYRRSGYSEVTGSCHKNLHQSDGYMLATADSDLIKVGGGVLYSSLGVSRVWYLDLPDGRTVFSNGLIQGITDGTTTTGFGVPIPVSIGSPTDVAGELFPGDYQYQITYVRLSDGLEGGPAYSNSFPIVEGGIFLSGLPVLSGYKINVYITSHNAGDAYLAGSTVSGAFSYIGSNDALVVPCQTEFMQPAPVGTVLGMYRGRALVAQGDVLFASRQHRFELFDMRRDYKKMPDTITMVCSVVDGIYVGTNSGLYFLAGDGFDKLVQIKVLDGPVVSGSGVLVNGEFINRGDRVGAGTAMVCIIDGYIVAGFAGGDVVRLTEGRYKTSATEVSATFRMIDGVPQYIAISQ